MSHSAQRLRFGHILKVFRYLLKYFKSSVLVQHLASTEKHGELYLVPLSKKLTGMVELYGQIMLVGFRLESYFLQLRGVLMAFFTPFTKLSFLLIEPLAIVHYSADGRIAHRCNFHKIQTCIDSFLQCLVFVYDPNLIVRFVDKPNFLGLNPSVYPQTFFCNISSPYLSKNK